MTRDNFHRMAVGGVIVALVVDALLVLGDRAVTPYLTHFAGPFDGLKER